MTRQYTVAVLGATGLVGETILSILHERDFPAKKVHALASARSSGLKVNFGDKKLKVEDVAHFDFKGVDIALFSAGAEVSAKYAPIAANAGCIVIDNTSHFRLDPDVPLIIAEVNAEHIKDYKKKNIIANPNCSTIQMLVALKPIYDKVGINTIHVSTYQSVSGSGLKAIEELANQTAEILNGKAANPSIYPVQIAFNLIPHIDSFEANGYTKEEMKMVRETHKILEDDNIRITPTTVRVPVFYGHSESIYIETEKKITAAEVRELLAKSAGIIVKDKQEAGGYPTPAEDASGEDCVFVGRIREDLFNDLGINLWVVSDNIRKGAALNSIQIAEKLVSDYL